MSALRNIRERKGFTISQLAARSGISGKTLLEYEEGRQTIPLPHAKLLAKSLWVQIEDLMPPPGSIQTQAPPPAPVVREAQPLARPAVQQPLEPQQPHATADPPSDGNPTPVAASRPPAPPRNIEVRSQPVTPGVHSHRSDQKGARAPKFVPPLSEGQMQELLHLAERLDITQEQLEERVGKPLAALSRPDATDWVKRLRAIADEIAPTQKVKYGRWPDSAEDQEAAYLTRQREAGALCRFRLFNGEEFSGRITDFTPYTITIHIAESDEEMVLRKLAIAYYRCQNGGNIGTSTSTQINGTGESKPEQNQHNHTHDDHHQPVDDDTSSNHVGQPDIPETDQMDEDRGI